MTSLKAIMLGAVLGMLLSPYHSHAFLAIPSSQATGGSVAPRLSVDSEGSIYLIWKEARDSRAGSIFFSRSTHRGQHWAQEPRWLDRDKPSGSRSSSPRLVSDGKGNIYAVWWTKHRDGKKDVVLSASKDFGASFGPAGKLNRGDGA